MNDTPARSLVNTLWVNKKTGKVVRVLTDANPHVAHRWLSMQGSRKFSLAAENLTKKYTPVDDQWLTHAPDGTTVPDLDGRMWTNDGQGQWHTTGIDDGTPTTDLNLWPTQEN